MGSESTTLAFMPIDGYGPVARSVSSAATITTRTRDQPDSTADPAETTIDDYDINTSTIVRTAVVSGVIVLVLTALVLFFKVGPSSCSGYPCNMARGGQADTLPGDILDSVSSAYEAAIGTAAASTK